jgi:AP-1 complex subunit beta-1
LGLTDFQVVANAVTALSDIHISAVAQAAEGTAPDSRATFIISTTVLNKLLIALNECSEWGRVAILNCLARYKAQDDRESEHICERVMPQFQHANGSVVLTAVRVGGLNESPLMPYYLPSYR